MVVEWEEVLEFVVDACAQDEPEFEFWWCVVSVSRVFLVLVILSSCHQVTRFLQHLDLESLETTCR